MSPEKPPPIPDPPSCPAGNTCLCGCCVETCDGLEPCGGNCHNGATCGADVSGTRTRRTKANKNSKPTKLTIQICSESNIEVGFKNDCTEYEPIFATEPNIFEIDLICGSETLVFVYGVEVPIHTSCSKPIYLGNVYGDGDIVRLIGYCIPGILGEICDSIPMDCT